MKYQMNVTITNPNTQKGFNSDLYFELECIFQKNEDTYGNQHYLSIRGKDFSRQLLDIRYDTTFRSEYKIAYLEKWAKSYWTGKDGAYAIKKLSITESAE